MRSAVLPQGIWPRETAHARACQLNLAISGMASAEAVLLPPGTLVDTQDWESRERWGVRVFREKPDGVVERTFLLVDRDRETLREALHAGAKATPWRNAAKRFYALIDGLSGELHAREELLSTLKAVQLRFGMLGETWPPPYIDNADAALQFAIDNFDAAFETTRAPSVTDRIVAQREWLLFFQAILRELQRTPPTLLDACIDVMTAAASLKLPDDGMYERVQELLATGTRLITPTTNGELVSLLLSVLGTHSYVWRHGASSTLSQQARFRQHISELSLTASVQGFNAVVLSFFRSVAHELLDPSSERSTHESFIALQWTFQMLCMDAEFLGAMANGDTPDAVMQMTPLFAQLLLHDSSTVWETAARMLAFAPVPGLFRAVFAQSSLWRNAAGDAGPSAAPAGELQSAPRLNDLRLHSLFTRLLEYRRAQDPGTRIGAAGVQHWVENFKCLMTQLVAHRSAHFLVAFIEGLGDDDKRGLRDYLADPGMGLAFLRPPGMPLRLVCADALWTTYALVARRLLPGEVDYALPSPHASSSGAGAGWNSPATGSDLAGDFMRLFTQSVANPSLDEAALQRVVKGLLRDLRSAPLLGTCILARIGEQVSAGRRADGHFVTLEAWLCEWVRPHLADYRQRILRLFPHPVDALTAPGVDDPNAFNRVGLMTLPDGASSVASRMRASCAAWRRSCGARPRRVSCAAPSAPSWGLCCPSTGLPAARRRPALWRRGPWVATSQSWWRWSLRRSRRGCSCPPPPPTLPASPPWLRSWRP